MERGSLLRIAPHASRALRWAAATLLWLATGNGHDARAQTTPSVPISIELNKLEPIPAPTATPGNGAEVVAGCRLYIVVTNPDAEPITQLRLDLILFGADGVIARRVAFDLAPLTPHKTAVRLFDLPGQPCDGISRVLINEVLGCQFGKHEDASAGDLRPVCMDRLKLSSRAKAKLIK
jgi:hypothetical protein